MKKKLLLVFALIMAMTLVACGGKTEDASDTSDKGDNKKQEKECDAAALVNELKSSIKYESELEMVEAGEISNYVDLEDGVEATLYLSNGTTAEEIGVFVCKDKATADKMLENVKSYLSDQSESFKNYIPKESDRIEGGVVEIKNNAVIMCISGDSNKAKEIINKY